MRNLDNVKALLELQGIHEKDDVILAILDNTEARLKVLLENAQEVPEELNYIIIEVAVSRFNRIGSEGYTRHGIEGENISLSDNDFEPYMNDISRYLALQKQTDDAKRGKLIFL